MARNGSGTYSLPEAPFVAGTVISSTAVNSDLSDIANALTGSIAANGETPITANLPMSGYKHTGVANASARTDYAAAGQVQDGAFIWCGTAGGTADALTLTPTPAISAYATGQLFRFKAGSSANTGATTVAVSGLTAKAVQLNDAALTAGDIAANKYYEVLYDGTQFQIQRVSGPSASSIATSGVTFTNTDRILGRDTSGGGAGEELTLSAVLDMIGSPAQGDILYRGSSSWARLAAGTSGQFLQTQGTGANPQWAPAGITLSAATATTSGTQIDFTGISSSAQRITVMFRGVSTNGTSNILIQIGDSGGVETSGYLGGSFNATGANYTAGFGINSGSGAAVLHGAIVLQRQNTSAFAWVAFGTVSRSDNAFTIITSGSKTLSDTLDRVRITTNSADTFDAGEISISVE